MAKPTIRASIPLVDKWPRTRVAATDRQQQARAGRFDKSVRVKAIDADARKLRQASTDVPKPRALRESR